VSRISYYPDMISIRNRPEVVTHAEYVIVAGGGVDSSCVLSADDIEILHWPVNTEWKKYPQDYQP